MLENVKKNVAFIVICLFVLMYSNECGHLVTISSKNKHKLLCCLMSKYTASPVSTSNRSINTVECICQEKFLRHLTLTLVKATPILWLVVCVPSFLFFLLSFLFFCFPSQCSVSFAFSCELCYSVF